MSARGFVVLFVVYTLVAIAGAVWHYHVDLSLGNGVFVYLHMFNIALGIINILRSIDMGLRYGWKE